jgi:hypothetical protein
VPKSLPSLFIAGLCSFFVGITVAFGQTPAVRDPLFGLSLPAASLLFERTDPALVAECGIGGAGSEQESWIFAATRTPDGEYLVLGGIARTRRDGTLGPWVQNWRGELVRLIGHNCVVIDPPREALMYPAVATIPLEKAVVEGLAADAVVRFSHVFGSRKQFIAALRRQNAYPDDPRLEALRSAIEASTLP